MLLNRRGIKCLVFSFSSEETENRACAAACCTQGGGEKWLVLRVVSWKDVLRGIVCSTPPPAAPFDFNLWGRNILPKLYL